MRVGSPRWVSVFGPRSASPSPSPKSDPPPGKFDATGIGAAGVDDAACRHAIRRSPVNVPTSPKLLVPKPTPAHPESPTSRISATHGAPENDERRLARSASLQSGCRTTLDYLMEAMARWQPGTSENRFGGQICRVSLPWRVREYSRDRMHPRIAPGDWHSHITMSNQSCGRHVRKHFFVFIRDA